MAAEDLPPGAEPTELPPGAEPLADVPPGAEPAADELPPGAEPVATPEAPPVVSTSVGSDAAARLSGQVNDAHQAETDKLDLMLKDALAWRPVTNPDREARVALLAKNLGIDHDTADKSFDTLSAEYEAANFNTEQWRKDHPEEAALFLRKPEMARVVFKDPAISRLVQAFRKAKDLLSPGETTAPVVGPESASTHQAPKPVVAPPTDAQAEQDAFNAERAKSEAPDYVPPKVAQVENAKTDWLAQQDPATRALIIAGQRGKEAEAGLAISRGYTELMLSRMGQPGQDEFAAAQSLAKQAQLHEMERNSVPLALGESEGEQVINDTAAGVVSSADVALEGVKQIGLKGMAGAVAGGAAGALVTKTPQGVMIGAARGVALVGGYGMAKGTFDLEAGQFYQQALNEKTDDGRSLTNEEATAGAVTYGVLATGIEIGELAWLTGPLRQLFEKGGAAAVKTEVRDMVVKDAGFRALLRKAFPAIAQVMRGGLGEGGEEGLQQATQDAVDYFTRSYSAGKLRGELFHAQKGPVIDVEKALVQTGMAIAPGLLLGGVTHGMEMGVHAYQADVEAHAGEHVAALEQAAATSPAAQNHPEAAADLVAMASGRDGRPLTHAYVATEGVVRYLQSQNIEAEAGAKQLLGEDGPRVLQQAVAGGEKYIEVPIATYFEKWGKSGAGRALLDETTTDPLFRTPRELRETKAEVAAGAQEVQARAEPGLDLEQKKAAVRSELESMFGDLEEIRARTPVLEREKLPSEEERAAAIDAVMADFESGQAHPSKVQYAIDQWNAKTKNFALQDKERSASLFKAGRELGLAVAAEKADTKKQAHAEAVQAHIDRFVGDLQAIPLKGAKVMGQNARAILEAVAKTTPELLDPNTTELRARPGFDDTSFNYSAGPDEDPFAMARQMVDDWRDPEKKAQGAIFLSYLDGKLPEFPKGLRDDVLKQMAGEGAWNPADPFPWAEGGQYLGPDRSLGEKQKRSGGVSGEAGVSRQPAALRAYRLPDLSYSEPYGRYDQNPVVEHPELAKGRKAFGQLPLEQRAAQLFRDPGTGLLNRQGFEALARPADRPFLAEFEMEGPKTLNEFHGHESFDAALRLLSGVLTKNVPDGMKDQATLRAWVKDKAQADDIAEQMQARLRPLSDKSVRVTTAVVQPHESLGATYAALDQAHKTYKAAEVDAGRLGHRKGVPGAFATRALRGLNLNDKAVADAPKTRALVKAAAAGMADFAAKLRETGSKVEGQSVITAEHQKLAGAADAFDRLTYTPEGLLTAAGQQMLLDNGFKVDAQGSADMRELQAANAAFGKPGANVLLSDLAKALGKLSDGNLFVANPHGDEFTILARGLTPEQLRAKLDTAHEASKSFVFFMDRGELGIALQEGLPFASGAGETFDQADRQDLPRRKEQQGAVAGARLVTQEEFDRAVERARARGDYRLVDVAEVLRGRDAENRNAQGSGQEVGRTRLEQPGAAPGPVWFSAVERAVASAKQEKNTPAAWLALIEKTPGVKKEEVDTLGLREWLNQGDLFKQGATSVSRADVLDFVRAHRIEVVDKGLEGENRDAHKERALEAVNVALRASGKTLDAYKKLDPGSVSDLTKEAEAQVKKAHHLGLKSEAQIQVGDLAGALDSIRMAEEANPISEFTEARWALEGRANPETNYESYTLNGHKPGSYKEVLLYAPGTAAKDYKSGHFGSGGKGLLAHARISEHVGADGKPVMMIEEIQSDLHQGAREKGYERRDSDALRVTQDTVELARRNMLDELKNAGVERTLAGRITDDYHLGHMKEASVLANIDDGVQRGREALDAIHEAGRRLRSAQEAFLAEREKNRRDYEKETRRVPNAPFKTTWDELVAKRLLRYAAEQGFERIAWTTGEQQAERYDLAKQVDEIHYYPDTRRLVATKGMAEVLSETVDPERLEQYVGKDIAKKLVAPIEKPAESNDAALEKATHKVNITKEAFEEQWRAEYGEEAEYNDLLAKIESEVSRGFSGLALMPSFSGSELEDALRDYSVATSALDEIGRSGPEQPFNTVSGKDLKIGGEGMRQAYDRRLPSVFEKLVKKQGGKVEKMALKHPLAPTADIKFYSADEQWHIEDAGGASLGAFDTQAEAEQALDHAAKQKGEEVWSATLPAALREQVVREGLPLFAGENDPGGARGATEFFTEGLRRIYTVLLNENADASTVPHELAHVILEQMVETVRRDIAQPRVREDLTTVLKWGGLAEGNLAEWDALTNEGRKEIHEKLAPAFEAYLLHGKPPVKGLTRLFTRMKLWLLDIYKDVRKLGGVPPKAITDVFDRLLATEEELKAERAKVGRRPMFASPAEAGMSPEEWTHYLADQAEAFAMGNVRAEQRALKDASRETEAWWKTKERELRDEATAEYEKLPAKVVREQMKAQGIKLHHADVVEMVGAEGAKKISTSAEGGLHPNDAVEFFAVDGKQFFPTGDDMVKALAELPPKAQWVKNTAATRMAEQYPDILDARTEMRAEIQKGLHGDYDLKWLKRQWDVLRKRAGLNPLPIESVRDAAKKLVEARRIGKLNVGQTLAAERAAANRAIESAAAQNWPAAHIAQEQQLLNIFLWRELSAARDERDAFLERSAAASKLAARAKLGKAHPLYRDGVDLLLETFELKDKEQREVDLPRIGQVVERMNLDGATVGLDEDALERLLSKPKSWKSLSLTEMRQVDGAMKNIKGAANTNATALIDGKRVDKNDTLLAIIAEARRNLVSKGKRDVDALTAAQKVGHAWNLYSGMALRPETMLSEMVGGTEDLNSTAHRALIKPLLDARALEADLMEKHLRPVLQAWEKIPAATRATFDDPISGEKLFPQHFVGTEGNIEAPRLRHQLLMMALHSGTQSSFERLTEGRHVTEQQLNTAFKLLTKEELDWVQSVWSALDGLWPLARDLEERDSGLAPPKLEHRPLVTQHGTYEGGYFPAIYTSDEKAGQRQEANAINDMLDASFTRPGTARSHLKRRVEGFSGLLSLNPSTMPRAFAQVVHDIAFREAVKSVGGLVLGSIPQADGSMLTFQSVMRDRLGVGRAATLLQWVKDVGQMRGQEGAQGIAAAVKMARWVKGNAVYSVLGYSAQTFIGDFTGVLQAVPRTDLRSSFLGSGVWQSLASPFDTNDFAEKTSGGIRARRTMIRHQLMKQVHELTMTGVLSRGPLAWVKEHAFDMARWVDRFVSNAIWKGRYDQGIADGHGEAAAIEAADAAVRRTLPSESVVDLPAMLRDKGMLGAMLMFQGYWSTQWNGVAAIAQSLMRPGESGKWLKARVAGRLIAYLTAGAVFSELLSGRGPEGDDEDWRTSEGWARWYGRKMVSGTLAQFPIVGGDLSQLFENKLLHKQVGARQAGIVGAMTGTWDAIEKVANEDLENDARLKAAIRALGPWSGIPANQLNRTGGYIFDLYEGNQQARTPFGFASGVIHGERDNQPTNLLKLLDEAAK